MNVLSGILAAGLILGSATARAEESAETRSAAAAQDFDLSGARDAGAAMAQGEAAPAQTLRAIASGKFSAVDDGTRNLPSRVPPPAAPSAEKPSEPSGFGGWVRARVDSVTRPFAAFIKSALDFAKRRQ